MSFVSWKHLLLYVDTNDFLIFLSSERCVHVNYFQLIVFNIIQFLLFDIIQFLVFTERKRSKGTKREDGKN